MFNQRACAAKEVELERRSLVGSESRGARAGSSQVHYAKSQMRLHLDNNWGVFPLLKILEIDLVVLLLDDDRMPPPHHPQLPPKLLHPHFRNRFPRSAHPLPYFNSSTSFGVPLDPCFGERRTEHVEFAEEKDVQSGHLVAEEGRVEEGELGVEEGEEGGVEG